MMDQIVLKDICRVYNRGLHDEKAALTDVNLDIPQGGYYTFIGASGSGKSTLMNIIGLMDRPTNGEYYLNGAKMGETSERERARLRNRSIGFIFQNFGLIEDRSTFENVLMPILFDAEISFKEGRKLAMAALEQVGLMSMSNSRVTRLSGGERQRVAIARAIVKKCDIILADEPTGQLDSTTAKSIMHLLIDLNRKGTTLLVVTHNSEIAKMCPDVIALRDGYIDR